ncbi:MAG: hypothetical protein ABIT76_14600 [Chthoniobacterales bacterium]
MLVGVVVLFDKHKDDDFVAQGGGSFVNSEVEISTPPSQNMALSSAITPPLPTQSASSMSVITSMNSMSQASITLPSQLGSLPNISRTLSSTTSLQSTLHTTSGGSGGEGSVFGNAKANEDGGLEGVFYDLKQDNRGKPTKMFPAPGEKDGYPGINEPTNKNYDEVLRSVINSGMNDTMLRSYFHGPSPLYASHIFIPEIKATKAFGLGDKVQPKRWVVLYRGKVSPSVSGRYRFVGAADDILLVRFENRLVLDGSLQALTPGADKKSYHYGGMKAVASELIEVRAGISYNMEIMIGERPGGEFSAYLLLEKDQEKYDVLPGGGPKLPVFKMRPGPVASKGKGVAVANDTIWSVWLAPPDRENYCKELTRHLNDLFRSPFSISFVKSAAGRTNRHGR